MLRAITRLGGSTKFYRKIANERLFRASSTRCGTSNPKTEKHSSQRALLSFPQHFHTNTKINVSTNSPTNLHALTLPTLKDLERVCAAVKPEFHLLTDQEKSAIIKQHPLSPYLSQTTTLPMHPITGEVDFRFIAKQFFVDPVIEQIKTFTPQSGTVILLQAVSGAGKTGSIFALAREYFVLYLEVRKSVDEESLDYLDLGFHNFILEADFIIEEIKDKNLSPRVQTTLMTCLTQLLWLSQALLLHKLRSTNKELTPANWLAYLMNGGGTQVQAIFVALNEWFANQRLQHGLGITFLGRLSQRLMQILGELTSDAFFAVDEAQIAQTLFPDISFTSTGNKQRSFLSVLGNYSQPKQQSCIITGTRMTNFDDLVKSGESKAALNNYRLYAEEIDFPIVTADRAIELVSQYFGDNLKAYVGLQQDIGYIAQGRIRRSANLPLFIWRENKTAHGEKLADMVQKGLAKFKQSISSYVFRRLNELDAKFTNAKPELQEKWTMLLEKLFRASAVSRGDFMLEETCFDELKINIEDLGFALVTKAGTSRMVSIKEPYSFELFRTWLLEKGTYRPFVEQFENAMKQAVEPELLPTPDQKGHFLERLVGAYLLHMPNTTSLQELPFMQKLIGVKFPQMALNSITNISQLEWTLLPYTRSWTSLTQAVYCQPLLQADDLLQKANLNATFAQLENYFIGSIFAPLFGNTTKQKKQLVRKALKAIQQCKLDYRPELIMLLTKFDGALILPSTMIGPDLLGFNGGVLFAVACYLYSPTTPFGSKERENFDKLQQYKWYSSCAEARQALTLINRVTTWKEIQIDIGIPRQHHDPTLNQNRVYVPISKGTIDTLLVHPQRFKQILEKLGF